MDCIVHGIAKTWTQLSDFLLLLYYYRELEEEKEKVKSCLTLCDPMDYTVHGILQARILGRVAFPFSRGSSQLNPGIKSSFLTLQADSLPAEPQGKPRNTGIGSLSLLQQIFLTQEPNQGLLHCRQILYQLSYQGKPPITLRK